MDRSCMYNKVKKSTQSTTTKTNNVIALHIKLSNERVLHTRNQTRIAQYNVLYCSIVPAQSCNGNTVGNERKDVRLWLAPVSADVIGKCFHVVVTRQSPKKKPTQIPRKLLLLLLLLLLSSPCCIRLHDVSLSVSSCVVKTKTEKQPKRGENSNDKTN